MAAQERRRVAENARMLGIEIQAEDRSRFESVYGITNEDGDRLKNPKSG